MKNTLFISLLFLAACLPAKGLAQSDPEAVMIKESEAAQARERENQASEDPLKQRQTTKVDTPDDIVNKKSEFGAYTSLRLRYRSSGSEGVFDDGGSRIGANAHWQFKPDYWLSGRVEAGFNLLNRINTLFNPGANSSEGDEDVFLRLFYANLETPHVFLALGKAWSTYYAVAGFTDRFAGTGGSASGAFNAGTDGGPTGTGRADEVLQSRIHINPGAYLGRVLKPFLLNIQVQNNQLIPDVLEPQENGAGEYRYDYSFGLSALLETREDFNLGIAYNLAAVREEDLPELRTQGIDGDASALLLGGKWFNEKWFLATNFSWMENHMSTGKGVYFDGKGWETYGQYNVHKRWWVTAGWNYLKPDKDQLQVRNYQVKYGVVGLRYSIKDFNRMFYANIRFDSSTASDVSETGASNTYTVGVRWNIPK